MKTHITTFYTHIKRANENNKTLIEIIKFNQIPSLNNLEHIDYTTQVANNMIGWRLPYHLKPST